MSPPCPQHPHDDDVMLLNGRLREVALRISSRRALAAGSVCPVCQEGGFGRHSSHYDRNNPSSVRNSNPYVIRSRGCVSHAHAMHQGCVLNLLRSSSSSSSLASVDVRCPVCRAEPGDVSASDGAETCSDHSGADSGGCDQPFRNPLPPGLYRRGAAPWAPPLVRWMTMVTAAAAASGDERRLREAQQQHPLLPEGLCCSGGQAQRLPPLSLAHLGGPNYEQRVSSSIARDFQFHRQSWLSADRRTHSDAYCPLLFCARGWLHPLTHVFLLSGHRSASGELFKDLFLDAAWELNRWVFSNPNLDQASRNLVDQMRHDNFHPSAHVQDGILAAYDATACERLSAGQDAAGSAVDLFIFRIFEACRPGGGGYARLLKPSEEYGCPLCFASFRTAAEFREHVDRDLRILHAMPPGCPHRIYLHHLLSRPSQFNVDTTVCRSSSCLIAHCFTQSLDRRRGPVFQGCELAQPLQVPGGVAPGQQPSSSSSRRRVVQRAPPLAQASCARLPPQRRSAPDAAAAPASASCWSNDPNVICDPEALIVGFSREFLIGVNTPPLSRIPNHLVTTFRQQLTRLVNLVEHHDNQRSTDLLLLASRTLFRGGKERDIAHRLRLWKDGQLQLLHTDLMVFHNRRLRDPPLRKTDEELEQDKERYASRLMKHGQFGRAMKTITSGKAVEVTPEVVDKFREKTPARTEPLPESLIDDDTPVVPRFDPDDVKRAINDFPSMSAGGQGDVAPDLWKFLVNRDATGDLLGAISRLLHKISNGNICESLQVFLTSVRGVALEKGNGDIRPLGIGCYLRRLTGKLLNRANKEAATELFEANDQFGRSSLGCERNIADIQERLLLAEEDHVLLLVDRTNAFNLADRGTFLRGVKDHFPHLLRFVELCYLRDVHIFLKDFMIEAGVGTSQGCCNAIDLFCLAQLPVQEALRAAFPHIFQRYIVDDSALYLPVSQANAVWRIICDVGRQHGLHVNADKCHIITTNSSTVVPADLIPDIPRDQIVRGEVSSFKFLGVHLSGSVEAMTAANDEMVTASVTESLVAIGRLQNNQLRTLMLRMCVGFPQVVRLLRILPPAVSEVVARSVDRLMEVHFVIITGVTPVGQSSHDRIKLPAKYGGLGIRSAEDHRCAAYISNSFSIYCLQNPDDQTTVGELIITPLFPGLGDAVLQYNRLVAEEDQLDQGALVQAYRQQKFLSDSICKRQFAELFERLDAAGRAQLNSCTAEHASTWLNALQSVPNRPDIFTSDVAWVFALMLFLGIPTTKADDHVTCNGCQRDISILIPAARDYHFLTCRHGGDVPQRHNAIRDCIAQTARSVGIAASTEQRLIPNSQARHGDVVLNNPQESVSLAIDIAVTHPAQPRFVSQAAITKNFACNEYARLQKEGARAEIESANPNLQYEPVVWETFGASCNGTKTTINFMSTAYSLKKHCSVPTARFCITRKIQTVLWKYNARAIVNKRLVADQPSSTMSVRHFSDAVTATSRGRFV